MEKLYEFIVVHKSPFFRKMRVESGFIYNFYDPQKDEYCAEWIFVPDASEQISKLQHFRDTTVGLWATNRPDLIQDPKGVLFEIK